MIQSKTYQVIALLLSLSILAGIAVPTGLHAMSHEMCDTDHEMHQPATHDMAGHGEDYCPMPGNTPAQADAERTHHQAYDLGLACACSVDNAPLTTKMQLQKKDKKPVLQLIRVILYSNQDLPGITTALQSPIPVHKAYSPPPIFLVNDSFLI